MEKDFMYDACVCINCKECGKNSSIPAMKVEPGVKCQHCGKELTLQPEDYAAKQAAFTVGAHLKNVNFG